MKINRKKLNDLKLDIVILAGGKGTRISKYLGNLPKPMLKFNQKNFLKYLIQNFSKYPFRKIYILTGYKFQSIHKEFNNKVYNFVPIECINEKKLMGTGGALLGIKNKIKKHFILINGDTIFDVNPYDLVKLSKSNVVGAVALVKNKNQSSKKLNLLRIKNKKVLFSKNGRLMNGGVYYFKKSIFNYLQKRKHSLENDVLPQLITLRKINGKVFDEFFLDIGTPKYYQLSENKLKNYYQKPVAFLDRDGVINYDRAGYVFRTKDFIFRKNVIEGLNYLNKKNYYLFIVTNQAGIGKKIYSVKDFYKLHTNLKLFLASKNVFLHDVKFSPYHLKAKIKKYRKDSGYRKPGNLMIKELINEWHVDVKKSFMIGDKITDYFAAKKSSLPFYFVENDFFKQIKKLID